MAYQNDPEGALIQFASPDEAKRAMQSTEAVLNNRFIRVHWFRDDGSDGHGHSHSQLQPQTQPAMVKKFTFNWSLITCGSCKIFSLKQKCCPGVKFSSKAKYLEISQFHDIIETSSISFKISF